MWEQIAGKPLSDWLNGRSSDYVNSQMTGDSRGAETVQSLQLLAAVADKLASISGRKNLIWISEGFPLVNWGTLTSAMYAASEESARMSRAPVTTTADGPRKLAEVTSFYSEMSAAIRRISDDNVAIYPIDALPLDNPAYNAEFAFQASMSTLAYQEVHPRQNAMDDIAKKTGGKAFYETNDLMHAIRVVAEDSRATYTLGFYSDKARSDWKFHTLKVKVVGRPGVRLRYREGYVDSPQFSKDELSRRIDDAVGVPFDYDAVGLFAELDRSHLSQEDSIAGLHININAADLVFAEHGTTRRASVYILLVQKDGRGTQLEKRGEPLIIDADVSTLREELKNGVVYKRDVRLNRGINQLRVVVMDLANGSVGALTIPHSALTY